jgi:hypothetical protein
VLLFASFILVDAADNAIGCDGAVALAAALAAQTGLREVSLRSLCAIFGADAWADNRVAARGAAAVAAAVATNPALTSLDLRGCAAAIFRL